MKQLPIIHNVETSMGKVPQSVLKLSNRKSGQC